MRTWSQLSDKNKSIKLEKDWVPISEISSHMILAAIAAEDQKFNEHSGFDWDAMQKAWEDNQKGKRIKGGSTISQQTAKNVFLWPGRNLVRKGLEAYFTYLMEKIWGKERIIEVYLNVIEMGEGIYGIEAASQHYFGKSAKQLTRQEAALIAAIFPNPRRWNPKKPTPYLLGRQQWILKQMNNLGTIELKKS